MTGTFDGTQLRHLREFAADFGLDFFEKSARSGWPLLPFEASIRVAAKMECPLRPSSVTGSSPPEVSASTERLDSKASRSSSAVLALTAGMCCEALM